MAEENESSGIHQVVEAADRAGAIVTEQVKSIIDGAEERAAETRRQAEEDARRTREAASEAAMVVLGRIDSLEGPLGELVAGLRSEAQKLAASGAAD
ncbi:MAG: hypothetical protein LC713_06895 [Actinobacteria bacterium]|nr:hypothetical protein [Actinomycetota bacterium]